MERFHKRPAIIGSLALSALFTYSGAALAFGSLGTSLNTTCASRGGTPSQPYTAGNCSQCHDDGAGGPGAGKTAYLASNWNYFCPVAAANAAPIANPGGPYSAQVGHPVSFDGSASADAENHSLTFRWDFGDGNVDKTSGAKPTHTYATAGSYTVALAVNDGTVDSTLAKTTAKITDAPIPPVADLQLSLINDWAGIVGVPLKIPLAATDSQGKPLFFSVSGLPAGLALVDGGNGSGNINGTPQVAGNYTPTVTVVDNSSPVRSDVQTFALVIADATQPPAGNVEYQTKASASWQRESKQLRVRGRVLPVVDNAGDTERTNSCMPLAGKALTVTNEMGKTVLSGAVDCRGGYQLQGLVNILDTSCSMTVAVNGAPSASTTVRGAPGCKDVGKRDQEKELSDTRRAQHVNDDEHHN